MSLLNSPMAKALAALFDHLPDVCFFVKDSESRFLHVNRTLLDRLSLASLGEIVGTSDHHRYPAHIADRLVAGDRRVMESGEALIDHAEVLFDREGRLEWFSTSKFPVIESGVAIGVVGITRPCSARPGPEPGVFGAARAIDLISADPANPWRIPELAKRCGLSDRQLHRQFLRLVKMSPSEFLLRSRLHAASADLRRTSEPLASLAEKYGFCDQSAFTRQFRRIIGTTPAKHRDSFRKRI